MQSLPGGSSIYNNKGVQLCGSGGIDYRLVVGCIQLYRFTCQHNPGTIPVGHGTQDSRIVSSNTAQFEVAENTQGVINKNCAAIAGPGIFKSADLKVVPGLGQTAQIVIVIGIWRDYTAHG